MNKFEKMQTLKCWAFKWIGQSFESCNGCGHPYWEHTHIEGVRRGRWRNQLITDDEAQRVRDKWEGYGSRRMTSTPGRMYY